MRVLDALNIIRKAQQDAPGFQILLACGSSPLHLKTYLHAYTQQARADRRVTVSEGLYGDLCGTLERPEGPLHGIALVIEWPDLDSRLGYRSSARWTEETLADIVTVTGNSLRRIEKALEALGPEIRVAVSLPTLPLPPLFHTAGWQASQAEVLLDQQLASFCANIASRPGLAIVNARRLAEESPQAGRFDFKADLYIGFPYSQTHTVALAVALSRLLAPPAPKKGIITDLDDTLWNGIAGEVGADGVSWDFTKHHHLHALYQNLLSSLAGQGILVAVASKNDPQVVTTAFERKDILLRADQVFPFEVHWNAKSGSVGRILETWNIGADSVIFIDDSPMELAEVAAAYPGIECIRFPKDDYAAGLALLKQVRDLCGKERISAEDALRLNSIRQGQAFREQAEGGAVSDDFLKSADATVTIDFSPPESDGRVVELVNKTNQFNLNGLRRAEADWHAQNKQPGSIVAAISYEDKFGPLGKIAVFQGQREDDAIQLTTWVMSCRAFSRRIEHQCLRVLFERFDVDEIRFDFVPTLKNGPTQEFLKSLAKSDSAIAAGQIRLTRQAFLEACPTLYHRVIAEGPTVAPETKSR